LLSIFAILIYNTFCYQGIKGLSGVPMTEDINKYLVINLKDLKVKEMRCECGYRLYYVGSKVICPRCKRILNSR